MEVMLNPLPSKYFTTSCRIVPVICSTGAPAASRKPSRRRRLRASLPAASGSSYSSSAVAATSPSPPLNTSSDLSCMVDLGRFPVMGGGLTSKLQRAAASALSSWQRTSPLPHMPVGVVFVIQVRIQLYKYLVHSCFAVDFAVLCGACGETAWGGPCSNTAPSSKRCQRTSPLPEPLTPPAHSE